jgi:hypothetical protein
MRMRQHQRGDLVGANPETRERDHRATTRMVTFERTVARDGGYWGRGASQETEAIGDAAAREPALGFRFFLRTHPERWSRDCPVCPALEFFKVANKRRGI